MITNSDKRIETTVNYGLDMFTPMRDHPFGVRDDSDMQQLMESIREYGVIVPILVRPNPNGDGPAYEIVSGHRCYEACRRLGITDIPAIVRNMDDEEAIFAMVDANLHRERLLPSEKAFAYKMKLDAIKRQGKRTDLTSDQVGQRLTSVEKVAAESDESKSQVQRYISLTRLIPELLQMVDDGKITLTAAVELSKFHPYTQRQIFKICDAEDMTPSYSQTVRMRKLADVGALGEEAIRKIMSEEKTNQCEHVVIYIDEIRQYYPRNIPPRDIVAGIKNLLRKGTWSIFAVGRIVMQDKKKYAWLGGFLSNVLGGERKYTFHKVTYIVEPCFRSVNEDKVTMPQEKFARIIEKSAAHLQVAPDHDKIKAEYVLDSAGKEEYADQNQTK